MLLMSHKTVGSQPRAAMQHTNGVVVVVAESIGQPVMSLAVRVAVCKDSLIW